jgi:hypothetical protein
VATPPTRVSFNVPTSGNFSANGASKVTASFAVQAGDLIVVMGSICNAYTYVAGNPSASGGSVTWTPRAQAGATGTNNSGAWLWTGAVGASATITVTLTRPTATNDFWGFSATVWRNHGGVGAVFNGNNATGSGAPSVAATCSANSAVQCQVNDWNAVTTARTWRTINGSAESESTYVAVAGQHTVYGGYRADTGSAGSITQGLTAPSNLRWVLVGVEILGTTSGTTHDLTSTGTGTSTGSLAVNLAQKTSSTGTGTTTGSANLLLAPGALSASGSGSTTGSANLTATLALSASGAAQTAGSVDVTLNVAPLSLSATGTGTTGGSAALRLVMPLGATGTGTSTGSADLTIVGGPLGLSAIGTGQTGGSLAMTATLTASSTGTGATTGSLAMISTLKVSAGGAAGTTGAAAMSIRHGVSATGTGQTAGSLEVTIPFGDTYQLTATGTGTTSGSLELTPIIALSASGAGTTAGSLAMIRTGQLRGMGLGGQTSGSLVLNIRAKLTASGSGQATGSLEMRVSTLRLSSTGYTFSSGSLDLTEPQFSFSPPTHEEPMRVDPDRRNAPLSYYRLTYAPSLVKVGGTWTAMRTPPPELLAGLTAGEDYFLGGFEYEIDQHTARELALAGYTSTPI